MSWRSEDDLRGYIMRVWVMFYYEVQSWVMRPNHEVQLWGCESCSSVMRIWVVRLSHEVMRLNREVSLEVKSWGCESWGSFIRVWVMRFSSEDVLWGYESRVMGYEAKSWGCALWGCEGVTLVFHLWGYESWGSAVKMWVMRSNHMQNHEDVTH